MKFLAEVAQQGGEKKPLEMLINAPNTALAQHLAKTIMMPVIPIPIQLRHVVGKHLLEVSTAKPQVRKNERVTVYFRELLKLNSPIRDIDQHHKENRLLACKALGSFGYDAKDAIPELQKLQSDDQFDDLREAAKDAIAKIKNAK